MYLLGLGIILALLKYLQIGSVAAWPWWWILIPFVMTVLWWIWADASGYTKRRAMDRMDKRRQERLDKQKESLGLGVQKKR